MKYSNGSVWIFMEPPVPPNASPRGFGCNRECGLWPPRDCDRNVCKLQSCSPTITRSPRHVLNGHSPGTLRRLRSPVSFAIISSHSTNSVTGSRQWLSFFLLLFFFLCSLGTDWHFIIHPSIWKLTLLCQFSLHSTAAVRGLTEFRLLP